MRFNAHVSYNGECEKAFEFYRECLGGEITLMMLYDSVPGGPRDPALKGKIVHATLKVGDQTLTGADVLAAGYEKPAGFALQLNIEAPEDAKRIYEMLSIDAVIQLPLQKTFWANKYAMLTDRFGTPWEINCA